MRSKSRIVNAVAGFGPALLLGMALHAGPLRAQDNGNVAAAAADPQPQAENSPFPARLSDVEGSVSIAQQPPPAASPSNAAPTNAAMPPAPPADVVFKQALMNMPVMAGMEVQTGADGRGEIQFADGGLARVSPNSDAIIVSLSRDGEQVQARSGLTYYEVPAEGQTALTVAIGPDVATMQPGTLLRVDMDQTPIRLAVLRGALHVANDASGIGFDVPSGQTASLDPSAASAYDVKDEVASNSWDAWNSDRDSALAEMAANQTGARTAGGGGNADGWNDLDYYGTWYDVPGAGMAWGPDGVDASFDPYGSGAWGYYSGAGYTWISAYPWGWLPYRCGGWSYFNSFGWLWQPGGCGLYGGAGWFPYAGIRNAPAGYRLPVGPFDPRLRTRLRGAPMPRPEPLRIVHRGPVFQFRSVGGTRPEPRAFALDEASGTGGGGGAVAPTLPLMTGQQFRSAGGAGYAGAAGAQREYQTSGRAVYTPAPRAIPAPSPRVMEPPAHVFVPPPQPHYYSAPVPHVSPPPAPAPAARPR